MEPLAVAVGLAQARHRDDRVHGRDASARVVTPSSRPATRRGTGVPSLAPARRTAPTGAEVSHRDRRPRASARRTADYSKRTPVMDRAITKRWISVVPSKIVEVRDGRESLLVMAFCKKSGPQNVRRDHPLDPSGALGTPGCGSSPCCFNWGAWGP